LTAEETPWQLTPARRECLAPNRRWWK